MIKEFTELELNIKALERAGIKVKNCGSEISNEINGKSYFQLKDIDFKSGVVSFYIAAFGNKDSDGDILIKGAAAKTVRENKDRIKHLYNHNKTQAPGVVQEVAEDSHGIYMISKMMPTTLGKDVLIEYEYKAITEHSMGYQVINEKSDNYANQLIEIKLWEGSSLTAWGANHNTPVKEDVKILEHMKAIENLLHNSNISDERAKEFELQMSQIKSKLTPKTEVIDYTDLLKAFDL